MVEEAARRVAEGQSKAVISRKGKVLSRHASTKGNIGKGFGENRPG